MKSSKSKLECRERQLRKSRMPRSRRKRREDLMNIQASLQRALNREQKRGRSSLLIVGSFVLTVGIWFGLLCLLVCFLLTVGIRFGLLCCLLVCSFSLTVPPIRKLGLVFFTCGSPTVSQKTNRTQKDFNCKQKTMHPKETQTDTYTHTLKGR